VVEDNQTNRIVLEEMLRHLGHRVTLAVDGQVGVVLARARRFDVVLMDLSMPLMDGWTAAAAIRTAGASRLSRIIAVTAHARPDRMDRFAASGIDSWLTKPLSTRDLAAALEPERTAPPSVENAAQHAGRAAPLLDTDRLEELAKIADPQALHRLLEQFQTRMDSILAKLDASVPTAPLPEIAAMCHEAAGAAAVIGAVQLHERLASMEAASNANDRGLVLVAQADLGEIRRETWKALAMGNGGRL